MEKFEVKKMAGYVSFRCYEERNLWVTLTGLYYN